MKIHDIELRVQKNIKGMRYPTWGDYYIMLDKIIFEVVDHKNDLYTMLTLIHEMVEYTLLEQRGVPIEKIDAFDIAFEKDPVLIQKYGEPGNDPTAPYYHEHQIAERVAKMMCKRLKIDYEQYNNCLND